MTPEHFRSLLDRLKLSQLGVGRLINVDGRTVRRWASGELPIPTAVALLFRIMVKWKITPDKIERIREEEDDGRETKIR